MYLHLNVVNDNISNNNDFINSNKRKNTIVKNKLKQTVHKRTLEYQLTTATQTIVQH